jgi:hypothetical protein
MLRRLPAPSASRTPSSDVLMNALWLTDSGARFDKVAASLPQTHGVVVAHAAADDVLAAYYVTSMRLWPRPVSLVTCRPAPKRHVQSSDSAPAATWRLDLFPRDAVPLRSAAARTADATGLCATPVAP